GKTDAELWPEETSARIRANDARVFEAQATLETQETIVRADKESRILLTLRFLFMTAGGERFVAGMAVDITDQKRAEEALHRLPQSILEAQEKERRRVARELHDGVNQAIASAKFRIQTAEKQILRGDPKWQETCSKSKEMLDSVLQQVRQLSHNLRPGELDDLGLVPAARTAIREFEARTGISVQLIDSGLQQRLSPALELTFYRVTQEALTNVEKHSGATSVEIHLENDGSYVTLEISDNGGGLRPSPPGDARTGLGLLHMRERASLVGGTFTLGKTTIGGARLTVRAPVQFAPAGNGEMQHG
ncbi:MAG TPA: histidine kinase, partial [Verrucomicrobiae bacterium]|nr:histidine kinase [Verrucomicrobiae bacterium]